MEEKDEKGNTLTYWGGKCDQLSEWISVNDRFPENNTDVLIIINGKVYLDIVYFRDESAAFFIDGEQLDQEITHWMPLPEPPK